MLFYEMLTRAKKSNKDDSEIIYGSLPLEIER